MNWSSSKPLAGFNSMITDFYVKNPFRGQHSIYHWSWDRIMSPLRKASSQQGPKLSFSAFWLAPSPSFFPPRGRTPWNCPKSLLPHTVEQLLNLNRTLISFVYLCSALIFQAYLLQVWYRCVCSNVFPILNSKNPGMRSMATFFT